MKYRVTMGSLAKFLESHREELRKSFENVIESRQFIGGPNVSDFEVEFNAYVSATHTIAVGNGTDALEISLSALDLPQGSEVLVPAHTFVATAEAVNNVGLRPIFVDIDSTRRIDLADLKAKITPATRALVLVHMFGRAERVDDIASIVERTSLKVIEDCAQAHGLRIAGKHVGTFFDFGTFSFYPGKNLGAIGDAGAIITNSDSYAVYARRVRDHGRVEKYDHELVGRNSRMDSLQAAVLRLKLPELDEISAARRGNAKWLETNLEGKRTFRVPNVGQIETSVFHQFTVESEHRDLLRQFLNDKGIETGIHYPRSVNSLPAYSHLNQHCPVAEAHSATTLSIPVGEHLEVEDLEFMRDALNEFEMAFKDKV